MGAPPLSYVNGCHHVPVSVFGGTNEKKVSVSTGSLPLLSGPSEELHRSGGLIVLYMTVCIRVSVWMSSRSYANSYYASTSQGVISAMNKSTVSLSPLPSVGHAFQGTIPPIKYLKSCLEVGVRSHCPSPTMLRVLPAGRRKSYKKGVFQLTLFRPYVRVSYKFNQSTEPSSRTSRISLVFSTSVPCSPGVSCVLSRSHE